ncbi:MAG: AAA family ATPase [DPANN group archaeon]|nr:AAA family ATPase [DPANN group archaeon]
MIIGLTGLALSGKDQVAKHLQDKYGYRMLVFSDELKNEVEAKGLEMTKMNK